MPGLGYWLEERGSYNHTNEALGDTRQDITYIWISIWMGMQSTSGSVNCTGLYVSEPSKHQAEHQARHQAVLGRTATK